MTTLAVTANVGKEIAEISSDFTNPIEVVREALHNSYDAGATRVEILAVPENLPDGRRVLTLQFTDNGIGMSEKSLERFFGLGYTDKPPVADRTPIGFKGHGTKAFYQAQDLYVVTRQQGRAPSYSEVKSARTAINRKDIPQPQYYSGTEAERRAQAATITTPADQGTVIRLVDYTPDSSRLIDTFKLHIIENYVRWFTVFGSFEHIVRGSARNPPFELWVRGTDNAGTAQLPFGHPWPAADLTSLKELKERDDRRPFNFFCKTFRFNNRSIEDGYRIDVAVLFEGKRARLERDTGITRQRAGGIYAEEERYGLWLCKDFIPVERRFEWLLDDECPKIVEDLRRPLILVNSQDFMLIANRGSVGNSSQQLLGAIKRAVFQILTEVQDDKDVERFLDEYQEDLFSRRTEKDQKALGRRIDRFNARKQCEIVLPNGTHHTFLEPRREITLFGLVAELEVLAPTILNLELLDYDDHSGIDMLVRRNGNVGDLLDRNKVAYVEVKFILGAQVNHAFDHLYAVVCWDTDLKDGDIVIDAANKRFDFEIRAHNGSTAFRLIPEPGSKISHNVNVIVLKKLFEEKYQMVVRDNPSPITKGRHIT